MRDFFRWATATTTPDWVFLSVAWATAVLGFLYVMALVAFAASGLPLVAGLMVVVPLFFALRAVARAYVEHRHEGGEE